MNGRMHETSKSIQACLNNQSLISYEKWEEGERVDYYVKLYLNGKNLRSVDFNVIVGKNRLVVLAMVPFQYRKGFDGLLREFAELVNMDEWSCLTIMPRDEKYLTVKVTDAFGMAGFDAARFEWMLFYLGHYCDKVLLPYARRVVQAEKSVEESARQCCEPLASDAIRNEMDGIEEMVWLKTLFRKVLDDDKPSDLTQVINKGGIVKREIFWIVSSDV